MKKEELIKFCLLYKGEPKIDDNPIKKDSDEFKWQMWRIEFVAVHEAIKRNITSKDYEDFFKDQIRNSIETYANVAFGGDATPYFERYFNY